MTLLGAFALGLFGSLHCLGMCGGIAGALGQAASVSSAGSRIAASGLHCLGRVGSYAIAGAIAGVLGQAFAVATGVGVSLRIVAGLLILAMALHVAGWWNGIAWIERLGLRLWRRIAPLAARLGRPDRAWKSFALGMLWGWLPCGLVYSALAVAATTGELGSGAVFMACFGLGTIPAMWAAGGAASTLRERFARQGARQAAGVLLALLAVGTLYGALMPLAMAGSGSHGAGHAASADASCLGGDPDRAPR
jgi:sulfite exporter TauE/SafE